MREELTIVDFMERAEKDPRVGPMHISLFVAILYCRWRQGGVGPVVGVSGKRLMPLAKIWGPTPIYKTLRELHAYGYIEYRPSYHPGGKSEVKLI